MHPTPSTGTMPHLEGWLQIAEPVRKTILERYGHLAGEPERLRAAEEENVLFAIENLHTYPCVQRRLEAGSLHLHGWFFKIATAELFAFDPQLGQFVSLLNPAASPASGRPSTSGPASRGRGTRPADEVR